MKKRELDVVAALIKEKGKFLLCQRKEDDHYANLWEFPGGTVEQGEDLAAAIKREINEELDLEIEPNELLTTICDEDDNTWHDRFSIFQPGRIYDLEIRKNPDIKRIYSIFIS